MIGLLGWALAVVVIAVRIRRRRWPAPRALLLAEATEKEDDRVACHAEGAAAWGPRGGDPRALEARADWPSPGAGVVWHALTEHGLKHFENVSVAGHWRCSCGQCADAASLRALALMERNKRRAPRAVELSDSERAYRRSVE